MQDNSIPIFKPLYPPQSQNTIPLKSRPPKYLEKNPLIELLLESNMDAGANVLSSVTNGNITSKPKQAGISARGMTFTRKLTKRDAAGRSLFGSQEMFSDIKSRVQATFVDDDKAIEMENIAAVQSIGLSNRSTREDSVEVDKLDFKKFDFNQEISGWSENVAENSEDEEELLDKCLVLEDKSDEPEEEDEEILPPDFGIASSPKKATEKIKPKLNQVTQWGNLGARNGEPNLKATTFLQNVLNPKGLRKKSNFSSKVKDSIIAVPTGPKEFVDPAILFVEKQIAAWEKMRHELLSRTGGVATKKFKTFANVIQLILGLRKLGLNANLMNRVDKGTLNVIVKIKLWRKRAMDLKASRREPSRKLIAAFDKQIMAELPLSIQHQVITDAIEISYVAYRKYARDLGESHLKTIQAKRHLLKLEKNIPESKKEVIRGTFSSMQSIFFPSEKNEVGIRSPKKVYPSEDVSAGTKKTAAMDDDELDITPVTAKKTLAPLRTMRALSLHVADEPLLQQRRANSLVPPPLNAVPTGRSGTEFNHVVVEVKDP